MKNTESNSGNRVFPELSQKEEDALKEEARALCKKDLHYLAKHILGYDRVTEHYHKKMCRDIDTPKYRFKLLLHPRGHFKSTLGTEARSIQKIINNPSERILLTNAKLENSRKFLRSVAHHFHNNAKFRWVFRDWWVDTYATAYHKAELKHKLDWVTRDTQDEFTVLRPYEGREASITTGSTEASLVSQHYSSIIADDLINRDFVRTVEMVEKSILYFKDILDLLDPDGALEIIGTRWAHMDLYNWIIEEFGGSASLRVPKDYLSKTVAEKSDKTPEEDKEWMISIQPCFDDQGDPVFPEEFTPKVLNDLRSAKGPYEFGAQYLLNPTPKENQRFLEEWFNKLDTMPDASRLQVCITVDPAKSLADAADKSAIAVCGYDDYNYMYFLDGLNEQLSIDELPEALFEMVMFWQKRARIVLPVGFEAVGFQETYIYNLERMMMERNEFFAIEPIKRRQQSKEERILRLVPRIKNGFYVPRKMVKHPVGGRGSEYDLVQRLMWQLTRFPFAGEDDLADALADQLDIVKANSLPRDKKEKPQKVDKNVFIHPSIMEDRRRHMAVRKKDEMYNDAVR